MITSPSTLLSTASTEDNSWQIDEEEFNIYLAVPNKDQDKAEEKVIKYAEHLYTISEEDLNTEDAGNTPVFGRRQFRKCHSKCVQTSCLPFSSVSSYTECVAKCKLNC